MIYSDDGDVNGGDGAASKVLWQRAGMASDFNVAPLLQPSQNAQRLAHQSGNSDMKYSMRGLGLVIGMKDVYGFIYTRFWPSVYSVYITTLSSCNIFCFKHLAIN